MFDSVVSEENSSLVFVDSGIENYRDLFPSFQNAEIVILDSDRGGVEQITEILANKVEIDNISILSHGDDGELSLGNEVLSSANLDLYSEEVIDWGDALTEDGDIFFYSCNLADTQLGQDFVEDIGILSRADIAASNDLTGIDGDWDLEVTIGEIDSDFVSIENFQDNLHQTTGLNLTDSSALQYLASNSDLIEAFGLNLEAAKTHFRQFGYGESRSFNNFDSLQYLASHEDLIQAFGTDTRAATEHYIQFGYSEGRSVDNFDERNYLAANQDLIQAFGTDTQAATEHYVRFGYSENRELVSNTQASQAFLAQLPASTPFEYEAQFTNWCVEVPWMGIFCYDY